MSLTSLANHLARPRLHAERASKLTETFQVTVQAVSVQPPLLLVPFPAFKSSGLQVVEAIAPDHKVLTGKPDAVANAENRVSKALGERVTLVGISPDTGDILFEVTDDPVRK
jgi:hypothetical protein